ncbi:uncharacterized protein LOC117787606 isoform X2 [Drosophila innubila]|uniref:uncharacterized protein LOC117787606 isoform X2 n=1 Tax=Drosophila innubila TaxID=198719 RepID=UPI00148C7922|nr:uncharacterized protein LOC117787606 isoform X2 [Drosophila innubila]
MAALITKSIKIVQFNAENVKACPNKMSPTFWKSDSDKEEAESPWELTSTNPFRNMLEDEQYLNQELELESKLSAECRMNNFIHRILSREAVPEYALSDAVFNVDKPRDAVALGEELPIEPLSEEYVVGHLMILEIIEVYSPFQFWFHKYKDSQLLNQMNSQINEIFSSDHAIRNWKLPPFFIKPGYICAVCYEFIWRRARIVHGPETYNKKPALAKRGTLTDVVPFHFHWPSDVTEFFRRLVTNRQLHGCIKDVDLDERILYVNLWDTNNHQVTVSSELIKSKLAGSSRNYCDEVRAHNNGRHLRYVRELLPTFDILESQLFPTDSETFENQFDEIIYKPEFLRDFQPPVLTNPFRRGLQDALVAWLEKFKPGEIAWRKLQQNAKNN